MKKHIRVPGPYNTMVSDQVSVDDALHAILEICPYMYMYMYMYIPQVLHQSLKIFSCICAEG